MTTAADAVRWIKSHRAELVSRFASSDDHVADNRPVTVFMAGCPGAGKTEFSIRLMETFEQKPVRIDADEIRQIIPGYSGERASVYQEAASTGLAKLYDHVLKKRLNAIIDGTFAHDRVAENVRRSLDKGRTVIIYYLYQDPLVSWDFTRAREKIEYRNIPLAAFVKAFFKSRENVNRIKQTFGKQVRLNVVVKDFERGLEQTHLNVEKVDYYVKNDYTERTLLTRLEEQ